MKGARKVLAVTAALCLFLVLNDGLSATQAHASTVYGLCISDKSSVCARSNGNGNEVDQWPQDISGDPNQQWDRTYLGQVADSGGKCWPFTCGNGLNRLYNNDSVWAFSAANSSQFDCLNNNSTYAYLQQCNFSDPGDMFVWTSTGVLVSVAMSDAARSPRYLDSNANYQPLFTDDRSCPPYQCEDTWVMRAGA